MRTVFFLGVFLLGSVCASEAQTNPTPVSATGKSAEPEFGIYTHAKIKEPYLAMTFDDGPSAELTPKLLDLLKERHIKATFFLVGKNVEAHPEIVRRIVAEGHEVGNHTWDHPQLSKLTDEQATDEIERTQRAITAACGVTPTLIRPPYGALNKPEHTWIPQDLKLNVIYWSVDTEDWKRPGAEVIAQRALDGARPGAIILQHDIHPQTIDAMPAALDGLTAKGFHLVTISELIRMERAEATPAPSPQTSASAGAPTPSNPTR